MTTVSELPKLPAARRPVAVGVARWPSQARLLLALTLGWLGFGLLMLFSASLPVGVLQYDDGTRFFVRQALTAALGCGLMLAVCRMRIEGLFRLAAVAFVPLLALVLLVKVPGIGVELNGARRWIQLGSFSLQPSELIKPCLLVLAAVLLPRWGRLPSRARAMALAGAGLVVGGVLLQPDLGTAALLCMVLWLMAFASGFRLWQLLLALVAGAGIASIKIATTAYQRARILAFLDPWKSADAEGYQLVQSLLAVSSGGTSGTGFGLSAQKLSLLPYPYSDFIFAVFCEEFGLAGALVFLAFLLFFLAVGMGVAMRAVHPVRRLLAAGSTLLLVGQSLLHIAVVVGAIPPKGIPLPLVSYGGSGLLASLLCCGLLIRAAIEMDRPARLLRVVPRRTGTSPARDRPAHALSAR
jgi:cell division protein FtsW